MARTYVQLDATSIFRRCQYPETNGLLCFRPSEQQVTDTALPANYQVYYVCEKHHKILRSTDLGFFTSTGDQRNDQVLDNSSTGKDTSDDIRISAGVGPTHFWWQPSTKDAKNKKMSGKGFPAETPVTS